MNTMEILENKIPELTQEDLILLLDWVTQALKRQAIKEKPNRNRVISVLKKNKAKGFFSQIEDPIKWQKEQRAE